MAPKRSASSDRMTQYTYLPRLSTGFAPAFGTAGTVRGDISRMTRDPAGPLRGAALSFLSAVRAARQREIHHDQVGCELKRLLERLVAVLRLRHAIAGE